MTTNISAFGLTAQLVASVTFPSGVTLSAFADDADPLDSPDFTVADTGSGLNGDMVTWSRANNVEIAINIIPTSEDDDNLDALLDANRVGKNKTSARDSIDMIWTYPSGQRANCSNGVIISGAILPQVAGSGRIKTRQYRFRFEQITKSKVVA
jgi:hypothetical protein